MGKRRESREAAIQFLFQRDLNPEGNGAAAGDDFWDLRPAAKGTRDFSNSLIQGVLKHHEPIDERISRYANNYAIGRIAAVDRNILRVAIYEMLFCDDVPPVVAINEAIEIAKRFGSEDSGRFVNGILDRVRLDLARPARTGTVAE